MIIKKKDSKESDVSLLENLIAQDLPREKKVLVEKELAILSKGVKGEQDAAYFIDFDFGSSPNWAVLHDLRIEHNGRVAQIDHLLINRYCEFYVLESKNFSHEIRIGEDGDFLACYKKSYHGIPSPIEQNRRHIVVLEACIKEHNIMPKRLGISITPSFLSYVVMSTASRITRPAKGAIDDGAVIKVDALRTTIMKEIDSKQPLGVLTAVAKLCSSESLKEIAQVIASFHRPHQVDYAKKFGITLTQPSTSQPVKKGKKEIAQVISSFHRPRQVDDAKKSDITLTQSSTSQSVKEGKKDSSKKAHFFCCLCREDVNAVVAEYCWKYKKIYDGKVYCAKCQKGIWEKKKGKGGGT